jgi:HTH-type transcriptional regulator / antitoxin HigA
LTVKPIRTRAEYKRQKAALERLMVVKPSKQTLDEIDVLSLLIEDYERREFMLPEIDPIDAIKFRMDQLSLTLRDLEPYIGSRSRVSEIMSGKRPLSLDMVRALNTHLGIPAGILIKKRETTKLVSEADLSDSLKSLLVRRKILETGETLADLIDRAGSSDALPSPLFRRTLTDRANARTNPVALLAWTAAVMAEANKIKIAVEFDSRSLTPQKLAEIARISRAPDWAKQVRRALEKLGIILIVMPHLPETYLDGAALRRADGVPVIAVTLRHDRIDNFWFVLLHELSHLALHFDNTEIAFFDDLELEGANKEEKEADQSAQDALIPQPMWDLLASRPYVSGADIYEIATKVGVHDAVIAGRVRRETADYRRFSGLVGTGHVRIEFPEYAARNG